MMDPARLEQFKSIAAKYPNDEVARYGLGSLYLKGERHAEAEAEFLAAIAIKPNYTAAYRDLGRALEKQGKTEEAIATYRKGCEVAKETGDLQTKKEMEVFLKRLTKE